MSENKNLNTMRERNMQQVSLIANIGRGAYLALTYAFLIIMALIVLFPFYWMIISSLKTLQE